MSLPLTGRILRRANISKSLPDGLHEPEPLMRVPINDFHTPRAPGKNRFHRQGGEISGSTCFHGKGSLTVEASLVMPLFLIVVYLCWLFFPVLSLQIHLQSAMDQTAGQLAQQSCIVQEWRCEETGTESKSKLYSLTEGSGITPEKILSDAAWKIWARSQIAELAGDTLDTSPVLVSGSSGIHVLGSTWDLDGDLNLRVDYRVALPVFPGISWQMSITQHCLRRSWTGSQSQQSGDEEESEEMVYVTDTGTVYHRDIRCYHLKVKITRVSLAAVGGKRNRSGGKYTPCEKCAVGVQAGSIVLITPTGDRYHTTEDCSGLKRTPKSVPLSSVSGMRACSNCGQTE